MPKYRLVIWDWNGTLQDDAVHIYHLAVETIFSHFKLPCPSFDEYKTEVTHDYMQFYRNHGIRHEVTKEELNAIFHAKKKKTNTKPKLFTDTNEALRHTQRTVQCQYLVSGCPLPILREELQHHKLLSYFAHIVGDACDKKTVFGNLMKKAGARGEETLIIGDFRHDAIAAHAVGAHPVLCTRGFHTREDLEPLLATIPTLRLVNTLTEIEKIFDFLKI